MTACFVQLALSWIIDYGNQWTNFQISVATERVVERVIVNFLKIAVGNPPSNAKLPMQKNTVMSLSENHLHNNRAAEEPLGSDSESDDEEDVTFFVDDCSDSIAAAAPENKVGYVYCMTNAAMPGLVKIGITIDLATRRDKLFSTGVPLPFDIAFARKLENTITPLKAEKALFRIFAQHRVYPRREFFKLALDPVRAAFSLFGSDVDLSVLPQRCTPAGVAVPVPTASP